MRRGLSTSTEKLLTKPIQVAVLGSGGREHALARKIGESPLCKKVSVIPGNDGLYFEPIAKLRTKIEPVAVNVNDLAAVTAALEHEEADLVVVGPDDLLCAGYVDALEDLGYLVFGPRKGAARIESSKAFAKGVLEKAKVSTAQHRMLGSAAPEELDQAASELGAYPLVLKYDGLALGKGVCVAQSKAEAQSFLSAVFEQEKFSRQGAKQKPLVLAEQFVSGHEISLFAITDGRTFRVLEPACDHKRLLEGNQGPNTGGMGAYSPVPWMSAPALDRISQEVFAPVLAEMRAIKAPFRGLLYAGLMVNRDQYWVLEFNARFGDPETQAVLPRLESDLLPLLYGVAIGELERALEASPLRWLPDSCVNIVLASRGYPEKPETGHRIEGIAEISRELQDRNRLYFAGVRRAQSGVLESAGGRVLSVSSLGPTIEDARLKALGIVRRIGFEGMQFREDIARVRSNF